MSFFAAISLAIFGLALLAQAKPLPIAITRRTDAANPEQLTINFKQAATDTTTYTAYIKGEYAGGVVMVTTDGNTWSPSSGTSMPENVAIPCSGSITLQQRLTATRLYISSSPLNFQSPGGGFAEPDARAPGAVGYAQEWGFVEFTDDPTQIYSNIAYVDYLGLPLGLSVGDVKAEGATADSVSNVCSILREQQASVPQGPAWSSLCIQDGSGKDVRALAPSFAEYWEPYVDAVWNRYRDEALEIDTQGLGIVSCQVADDALVCADTGGSDAKSYPRPTSQDIWGCHTNTFDRSGVTPLQNAVIPRLCAAFHRGTLLLAEGNKQPTDQRLFYTDVTRPLNWYCKAVKANESDKRGYCFPYDDVFAQGQETAGVVSSADTGAGLTVTIGGEPGKSGVGTLAGVDGTAEGEGASDVVVQRGAVQGLSSTKDTVVQHQVDTQETPVEETTTPGAQTDAAAVTAAPPVDTSHAAVPVQGDVKPLTTTTAPGDQRAPAPALDAEMAANENVKETCSRRRRRRRGVPIGRKGYSPSGNTR
ncbi:hypothetical protein CAC42_3518 [Sphaceloma murrayae]|uniref:GH64 domain-containing protein n=1 Tax=Sphaceloma murrayae TaxID=2082308 RepID=A0A2K1R1Q5_9PEZI|nr:hypothetical protein CAC42_3518 [Sphaceloma murrayae]